MDAHLPTDYVPDEAQKLELYRRLARARTPGDLAAFRQEVTDRFGPMPTAGPAARGGRRAAAGRRGRGRLVDVARGGLAGRALRGLAHASDGDAAAGDGGLPGAKPADITFASNQVRVRGAGRRPRAWALTQAIVARLAAEPPTGG